MSENKNLGYTINEYAGEVLTRFGKTGFMVQENRVIISMPNEMAIPLLTIIADDAAKNLPAEAVEAATTESAPVAEPEPEPEPEPAPAPKKKRGRPKKKAVAVEVEAENKTAPVLEVVEEELKGKTLVEVFSEDEVPAELAKAKQLKTIVNYFLERGYNTAEDIEQGCAPYRDSIPLLKRATNLNERITRILTLMEVQAEADAV